MWHTSFMQMSPFESAPAASAKPVEAPRGAFNQPAVTEHSVVVRKSRPAAVPQGVFAERGRV